MISKKGQEAWVSAALYLGIGIAIIGIVLGAGMPMINKLRDKNVVLQTKEVLFTLDNNIREVARSGPGSQRLLNIEIKKGEFKIDEKKERIAWEFESKAMLSEPGEEISEGNLNILTEGRDAPFRVKLWIDYKPKGADKGILDLEFEGSQTLAGRADLIIKNGGAGDKGVIVRIKEK